MGSSIFRSFSRHARAAPAPMHQITNPTWLPEKIRPPTAGLAALVARLAPPTWTAAPIATTASACLRSQRCPAPRKRAAMGRTMKSTVVTTLARGTSAIGTVR